ncbi:hypothetical protein Tco_1299171 [Tanacetum coccineum]
MVINSGPTTTVELLSAKPKPALAKCILGSAASKLSATTPCLETESSATVSCEVTDAECFSVLFGFCGKLKKLEEAKKVHDYFLRSGITGDVGLVHKMIDMYWNRLGDDGLEMYE